MNMARMRELAYAMGKTSSGIVKMALAVAVAIAMVIQYHIALLENSYTFGEVGFGVCFLK
jgi:hypothetical protein